MYVDPEDLMRDICEALDNNAIAYKVLRASDPGVEDHTIELTDKCHIQVGSQEAFACIVLQAGNGFIHHDERHSADDIFTDLKSMPAATR